MTRATLQSVLRRVSQALSREAVVWAIFFLSVLVTVALWRYASIELERSWHENFRYRVERQRLVFLQHVNQYEQLLRGAGGLFSMGERITREQWHGYVESLELGRLLPGAQALGFAVVVSRAGREVVEATVRAEGFANYTIYPDGDREPLSAVVFIEPLTAGNAHVLGYDMYVDPVRREAMERARDSGQPALSGKVDLLAGDGGKAYPGFLVFMPVYRHRLGLENTMDRRVALTGFVFSAFRADDLLSDFFRLARNEIGIAIYDGEPNPDNLLATSWKNGVHPGAASRHTIESQIEIAGHRWTAQFHSSPAADAAYASGGPKAVLLGGLVLSLLSFLMLEMNVRYQEFIREQAIRDPLTGLFNRRFMEETLEREMSRATRSSQKLAVAIVDLDHFKALNDTFGHDAGDQVLKDFAGLLSRFRQGTDVACRFGGEEFVLILPEIEPPQAIERLEELRRWAAELEPRVGDRPLGRVTVSIGLAMVPTDGASMDAVLKAADKALYAAKEAGRNRLVVSPATTAGLQ
ncbi:CHASE domain-containing protein [Propionivibrio soli]|uniref:CHASE domain-containing protein n=1 Tax=Propionivibrio soli TaxID=2976531 RepID=UPI0021E876CC|nr:CHASE domain-containing protein [Propionivibrio soli]